MHVHAAAANCGITLLSIKGDLQLLASHVDAAAVADLNAATQKLGICGDMVIHGSGMPACQACCEVDMQTCRLPRSVHTAQKVHSRLTVVWQRPVIIRRQPQAQQMALLVRLLQHIAEEISVGCCHTWVSSSAAS